MNVDVLYTSTVMKATVTKVKKAKKLAIFTFDNNLAAMCVCVCVIMLRSRDYDHHQTKIVRISTLPLSR